MLGRNRFTIRSWKYLKLPAGLDLHILDVLVLYIHYVILMMMMMMMLMMMLMSIMLMMLMMSCDGCLSMSYCANHKCYVWTPTKLDKAPSHWGAWSSLPASLACELPPREQIHIRPNGKFGKSSNHRQKCLGKGILLVLRRVIWTWVMECEVVYLPLRRKIQYWNV